MRGSRLHYASMAAVALLAVLGIYWIVASSPEPFLRDRMLVIPGGWKRFLGIFALACGGVAGVAYLYGLATRPLRAARYALTMATHVFLWVVIVLVFYPVVSLRSVSFNRNNTLATALPREGNLIVRSGVLPDPAKVSAIQYAKVTQEFHLHWYQVALFALLVLAVVAIVAVNLRGRYGGMRASRADPAMSSPMRLRQASARLALMPP